VNAASGGYARMMFDGAAVIEMTGDEAVALAADPT
jgi:hypothetical protein